MATHRLSILGSEKPDSTVPLDLVSAQITSATAPSVGQQLAYVMADGGSDEGLNLRFHIPKNYVGTPKLVVKGILDGAPSAGDDLAFGFRKRAVANNESADGTFDAEQTAQNADIGSTGTNHANEDLFEISITLTAGDYAVDDEVYGYVFIDASQTTYTGNFLLTDVLFEFTDV
jgi:hypothetical protein